MIWDACLARAVAAELDERLRGVRARRLRFDRHDRVVVVRVRGARLTADLAPGRGWVVLDGVEDGGRGAEAGGGRGRGARGSGGGGRGGGGNGGSGAGREDGVVALPAVVAGVEAVRDERVIVIRFRRVRGSKPHPALILELATNRWNALLADGPELRVRMRLRRMRGREHPIGQPWTPPGGRTVQGRSPVDLERWRELAGGEDPRAALLRTVEWTSPLNVDHLLAAPTPEEGFERWQTLAAGVSEGLWLDGVAAAHPDAAASRPAGSLLRAMAAVRDDAAASGAVAANHALERRLANRLHRIERMLAGLRRELGRTDRAARLREDGTLLLSSLHLVEPGTERVTLVDFGGTERTIALDPGIRPQEQASAFFRRAARLERAARQLPERIEDAEVKAARTRVVGERWRAGEITRDEAEAFLERTAGSRPGRAQGGARGRQAAGGASPPYHRYTSSGGLEIRVGRGARHNDDLTFRHARPNDVWLHARHAAGAHVILRWTRPERPPKRDLEEAAVLAATRSRARGSDHVPVDWTRRKWVRKPRGSRPGVVVPDRVQTLFVTPDPELADRLARGG